jgi:hypothetical protein
MSLQAKASKDKETREGSFRIEASELGALGLPQPVQLAVPANTLVVGRYFWVSTSWSEYSRSVESRNLGFGPTPTFPVVGGRRALDIGSIGFASERLPKIARVSENEISTLDVPVR